MPWCRSCLNDDGVEMREDFREHVLERAEAIASQLKPLQSMMFTTPKEKSEERQDYDIIEREVRRRFWR